MLVLNKLEAEIAMHWKADGATRCHKNTVLNLSTEWAEAALSDALASQKAVTDGD